jgi:phage repressor protein C with HTH and peptisase S24 domain
MERYNRRGAGPRQESRMTDEESPFDRDLVRATMKEAKVTQKDLADRLGLNQSAVSNILNGSRQVKVHEAAVIYRILGLNRPADIQMVPVIGLTSAGNWREAIRTPGGRVPMPSGQASERAFAVEVKGDSMDQLVQEGEFVVCDPEQTQLYNDKVYLIENAEHETQVKLYRANPARFEPMSSNETHQPLYMGQDPIKVIGRVVWRGGPL